MHTLTSLAVMAIDLHIFLACFSHLFFAFGPLPTNVRFLILSMWYVNDLTKLFSVCLLFVYICNLIVDCDICYFQSN